MLYQLSYARIRRVRLPGSGYGGKRIAQRHRTVAGTARRRRRAHAASRHSGDDVGLLVGLPCCGGHRTLAGTSEHVRL